MYIAYAHRLGSRRRQFGAFRRFLLLLAVLLLLLFLDRFFEGFLWLRRGFRGDNDRRCRRSWNRSSGRYRNVILVGIFDNWFLLALGSRASSKGSLENVDKPFIKDVFLRFPGVMPSAPTLPFDQIFNFTL